MTKLDTFIAGMILAGLISSVPWAGAYEVKAVPVKGEQRPGFQTEKH